MLNKLPVYDITIDDAYSENGEDLGINKIAFTSNPAIITKGLAFSKVDEKLMFFADKLKYRVVAPIMKPMQIFRSDESGDYYVNFSERTVEQIYSKFMKNFTNKQVFNLEHDNSKPVPAYVLESWIVDNPEKDKALSTYGIQTTKGTVMMSVQFTDKEAYNQIVENEEFGFSIEGFLGLSIDNIINKQKQEQMNEQKMSMPAGQYTMGNQVYTVLEDGTFTIADVALADAPVEEDKLPKDEVVKEEMADALPIDAPAPDAAPADAGSNTYSKEEIDAKLEEIMQVIATLKAEDEAEDAAAIEDVLPTQMSQVKMSINDKLDAYQLFANANKRK